jgi:hypothetical protein
MSRTQRTRSIAGSLDLAAADLDARARHHRPADRRTLRAAARELASRGLNPAILPPPSGSLRQLYAMCSG